MYYPIHTDNKILQPFLTIPQHLPDDEEKEMEGPPNSGVCTPLLKSHDYGVVLIDRAIEMILESLRGKKEVYSSRGDGRQCGRRVLSMSTRTRKHQNRDPDSRLSI